MQGAGRVRATSGRAAVYQVQWRTLACLAREEGDQGLHADDGDTMSWSVMQVQRYTEGGARSPV